MPHPPVVIPEVGHGRERTAQKTIDAFKKAAVRIADEKPCTIVFISPHAPFFQDYVFINTTTILEGSLSKFGARGLKFKIENNLSLARSIAEHAREEDIAAGGIEENILRRNSYTSQLDHGTLVPLYFILKEYSSFKLVCVSTADLSRVELYKCGIALRKAVDESDEEVVLIASGDLSHRLSEDGPYGYNPYGEVFDRALMDALGKADPLRLMDIDEKICTMAGECGYRSFLMMMGAMEGYNLKSEVYSYEAPFGVGYTAVRLEPLETSRERLFLDIFKNSSQKEIDNIRAKESPHVKLARNTLETWVKTKKSVKPSEGLPKEMITTQAGVFVSIKKHGQLRGCIGTILPTQDSIAAEIINNAISAGTKDPRFEPVEKDELDELIYSVDVLGKAESIDSMDKLDVVRYGVIVEKGMLRGLLLPNLEGVDTVLQQVSIALNKAGIRADEDYKMKRFEVTRYK